MAAIDRLATLLTVDPFGTFEARRTLKGAVRVAFRQVRDLLNLGGTLLNSISRRSVQLASRVPHAGHDLVIEVPHAEVALWALHGAFPRRVVRLTVAALRRGLDSTLFIVVGGGRLLSVSAGFSATCF